MAYSLAPVISVSIGMRKIPAERSTIADLRVSDVGQRFGDQLKIGDDGRIPLQRAMAGQRADVGAAIVFQPDTPEATHPIDVDKDGRLCQAKIHRGNQALAACEKTCVIAIFCLERKCLLEGSRCDIFKGGRLHGARKQRECGPARLASRPQSMRRPLIQVKRVNFLPI